MEKGKKKRKRNMSILCMPYEKPSVMPQSEKECISFHLQMLGGGGGGGIL